MEALRKELANAEASRAPSNSTSTPPVFPVSDDDGVTPEYSPLLLPKHIESDDHLKLDQLDSPEEHVKTE